MALSKLASVYNIYIEGNIAAGKSTLLNILQTELGTNVECIPEPLEQWTNFKGHNLLQSMYSNNPQAFTLQTFIQLTMARIQLASTTKTIKITERSLLSERFVFIEGLKEQGLISGLEYDILVEWFDFLQSRAPHVSEIIYLRTDPDSAFLRLRSRARLEEGLTTLKYVRIIHELYEKWLMTPVIQHPFLLTVINSNEDISVLTKQFTNLAKAIKIRALAHTQQTHKLRRNSI